MKATFEAEDEQEIKLLAKSKDLAFFIWELCHNTRCDLERKGINTDPFYERINELLEEHGIIIDELVT